MQITLSTFIKKTKSKEINRFMNINIFSNIHVVGISKMRFTTKTSTKFLMPE